MDGISNGFMLVIVTVMGLIFLAVLLGTILLVCIGCSEIYEKAFPKQKKEWVNHRQPGEWEDDMDSLHRELEEMAEKFEKDSKKLSVVVKNSTDVIRSSKKEFKKILDNL